MKHTESIKNYFEFREIYNTGKSYANKNLIMYVRNNALSGNRIGISVSRKVGNSVVRHRITRLIRESYRMSENKISKGLDIVVVARINARDKGFHDIDSSLLHLLRLHKIVVNSSMSDKQ